MTMLQKLGSDCGDIEALVNALRIMRCGRCVPVAVSRTGTAGNAVPSATATAAVRAGVALCAQPDWNGTRAARK